MKNNYSIFHCSQSLSSLDGDSDEDEEDEDDGGSGAYQNIPSDAAQTSYSSSLGRSPGGSGVLTSGMCVVS